MKVVVYGPERRVGAQGLTKAPVLDQLRRPLQHHRGVAVPQQHQQPRHRQRRDDLQFRLRDRERAQAQEAGAVIDLHSHTNESDGTFTPLELLDLAAKVGLDALAISDHDTFAGFDQALPVAQSRGLDLVCGIELSTRVPASKVRTVQTRTQRFMINYHQNFK